MGPSISYQSQKSQVNFGVFSILSDRYRSKINKIHDRPFFCTPFQIKQKNQYFKSVKTQTSYIEK